MLSVDKRIHILGGGLAGTILAYHLYEAGFKNIRLYTFGLKNASSLRAAGLVNPITGKKLTLTWLANKLFPYSEEFYGNLEKKINGKFFFRLPILRPVANKDDYFLKKKELDNADLAAFASITEDKAFLHATGLHQHFFAALLVSKGGYLDIPVFLKAMHIFLAHKIILIADEEMPNAYQQNDLYIHATGYHAAKHPFWSYLPWALNKGQWMEVRPVGNTFKTDYVLNKSVFMIPDVVQGWYRIGATYSWETFSTEPTETARNELIKKAEEMTYLPFQWIKDHVGIRPATKDRRPFIGRHPIHQNHFIFNGFGSKAVSLVPYLAKRMVLYLTCGRPLPTEADIQRMQSI